MRSVLRTPLAVFVACAVAVAPLKRAEAGTIGVLTPYMLAATQATGGGWVVAPGSNFAQPSIRSYTSSLVGGVGRITAAEAISIAGRGGALAVNATVGVTIGEAAAAVARCLAGGALCVAGGAAAAAYAAYRYGQSSTAGQLAYDPGQAPVMESLFFCRYSGAPPAYGPDLPAACGAAASSGSQFYTNSNQTTTITITGCSGSVCTFSSRTVQTQVNPPVVTNGSGQMQSSGPTQTEVCPASMDPTNPAYSIPKGAPKGPDGKCPTARYNHTTATPQQAADKVATFPPAFPSAQWTDATREAVETGKQTIPGTIASTGPATQTGTPTTTTVSTPAGQTTRTTTPTYNYSYAGDTITYNETNVTVEGNTTTTTTAPAPELKVCGLPGGPHCNVKVDESGTPVAAQYAEPTAAVEAAGAARQTQIADAGKQSSLGLSMPSWLPNVACTPIPMWAPTAAGGGWTVDPCSSPGVALWRQLLGWVLGVMTVRYIWLSARDL